MDWIIDHLEFRFESAKPQPSRCPGRTIDRPRGWKYITMVVKRGDLSVGVAIRGAAEKGIFYKNRGEAGLPLRWGEGLAGVIHLPDKPCRGGWVLCPPFGQERVKASRFLYEWARSLSQVGQAVLRFDYRGTGESESVPAEASLEEYQEDILSSVKEFERQTGLVCRGLMGLRLGATLSALAARRIGRSLELVMVEPLADGPSYVEQLLRTEVVSQLARGGTALTRERLRERLTAGSTITLDGSSFGPRMYRSLCQVDLLRDLPPAGSRALIVRLALGANALVPEPLKRLERAYASSVDTVIRIVPAAPAWTRVWTWSWRSPEFSRAIHSWMEERPGPERVIPSIPASRFDPLRKVQSVGFNVGETEVFGTLHLPQSGQERPCRVILLPVGENCRTALFYVPLARALAERGWPVLRFDPRGIGDSGGDFPCTMLAEVYRMIQNGCMVPDAVGAMDYLDRELSPGKYVLAGLCGGAITASLAAAEDTRVVGLIPLELPFHFTRSASGLADRGRDFSNTLWSLASRWSGFLLMGRSIMRLGRRTAAQIGRILRPVLRAHHTRAGSDPWIKDRLGSGTNLPLVRSLAANLERGIPTLFVFAGGEYAGHYRSIAPVLTASPQASRAATCIVLEGADHSFINPGLTEVLIERCAEWLQAVFSQEQTGFLFHPYPPLLAHRQGYGPKRQEHVR